MSRVFNKRNIIFLLVIVVVVVGIVAGINLKSSLKKKSVECFITDKNAVSIYQRWTINFGRQVSNSELQNLKIKITDSKGTEVKVLYNTPDDMKSLEIAAPTGGYKEGEKYTLKISSDIPFTFKNKTSSSAEFSFTPKRSYTDKIIEIPDKNLEKEIRDTINKPSGSLYIHDVEGITSLAAVGKGIKNIEGIQYLVNLQEVNLSVNEIEDISPLEGLVYLEGVGLQNNKIRDISALEGMNLKSLALSGNNIKSYKPVKDMYNKLEWKDFTIN